MDSSAAAVRDLFAFCSRRFRQSKSWPGTPEQMAEPRAVVTVQTLNMTEKAELDGPLMLKKKVRQSIASANMHVLLVNGLLTGFAMLASMDSDQLLPRGAHRMWFLQSAGLTSLHISAGSR